MSTLMPASASGSNTPRAMPGRSGTPHERHLGDLAVEREAADLVAQLHVVASLMSVPGWSEKVERTAMTTPLTQPSSTARVCMTWAPWWASSSISS